MLSNNFLNVSHNSTQTAKLLQKLKFVITGKEKALPQECLSANYQV